MEEKKENSYSERQDRIKKIDTIKQLGMLPYSGKYDKTHSISSARGKTAGEEVSTAGRIVLLRKMGKVTFAQLQDSTGKMQIIFRVGELEEKSYKQFINILDRGDFIGVKGEIFFTQKGEMSILVRSYTFLSKAISPLPEKWHGIQDTELKYRKRYLDLIMNQSTKDRFDFKSKFVWELRNYYQQNGFTEIDTPVICNNASGALAKPFITHYNALDMDVFLRIAPEIYLKEAIIGGYEKIFEVARVFRNEGMDPSHLQDFTMVEHYCAYWDYEKNMEFTENMLTSIIKKLKGSLKFNILNRNEELIEVDFSLPWNKVSFREILIKDCEIDIDKFPNGDDLKNEIKRKGIQIDDIGKLGRGNLIDALYKKVSRPKLVNPTFLTQHPLDISPLARKNDINGQITDRFQLIINGWEILNAYSELVDPIDQKERFEQQTNFRDKGDTEAMLKDDEYIEALEYGMPPVSGWGMGIERIVALLTEQSNLRDVVMFPLLKPENDN
ncbi:MAG: lysine--tRNA ligase [Candidatus Paceibacterota bacterium]|jgi:lysyl-tRNA synthetase class 2